MSVEIEAYNVAKQVNNDSMVIDEIVRIRRGSGQYSHFAKGKSKKYGNRLSRAISEGDALEYSETIGIEIKDQEPKAKKAKKSKAKETKMSVTEMKEFVKSNNIKMPAKGTGKTGGYVKADYEKVIEKHQAKPASPKRGVVKAAAKKAIPKRGAVKAAAKKGGVKKAVPKRAAVSKEIEKLVEKTCEQIGIEAQRKCEEERGIGLKIKKEMPSKEKKMSVAEMKEFVKSNNIKMPAKGTGKEGKHLKADYEKAIETFKSKPAAPKRGVAKGSVKAAAKKAVPKRGAVKAAAKKGAVKKAVPKRGTVKAAAKKGAATKAAPKRRGPTKRKN